MPIWLSSTPFGDKHCNGDNRKEAPPIFLDLYNHLVFGSKRGKQKIGFASEQSQNLEEIRERMKQLNFCFKKIIAKCNIPYIDRGHPLEL